MLPGCGGDEPADDGMMEDLCGTCTEPAAIDLTMPVTSFRTHVLPIVRATCNSITCHGVAPAMATAVYPGAGLYLGPDNTMPAPDEATISSIVLELHAQSTTAPAVKVVEPGNEAASFLVAKLHGCQNARGLACTQQSAALIRCKESACGDQMVPLDQPVQLTADQKNVFRRWIAQGALDN
jgi:hypothetical protein